MLFSDKKIHLRIILRSSTTLMFSQRDELLPSKIPGEILLKPILQKDIVTQCSENRFKLDFSQGDCCDEQRISGTADVKVTVTTDKSHSTRITS